MLKQDYVKAPQWLRIAAEQGLPFAQYLYAGALQEGRGNPQDRLKAYTWFQVAMDGGYPASNELGALEVILTKGQIDRAKSNARQLENSVSRPVVAHGCTGWDGELSDTPTPPPPRIQHFCR